MLNNKNVLKNVNSTLADLKEVTKEWNKKYKKVDDETIQVILKNDSKEFS